MELLISYSKDLRVFSKYIKEAGLKVTEVDKTTKKVILSDKQEIDIIIAYLSRLLFTKTFYAFEKKSNLTTTISSILKKSFTGTAVIRQKILEFLRNDNLVLDLDTFLKYNISDIDEVYFEMLSILSIDRISNEIAHSLYGCKANSRSNKKVKANFLYAISLTNFYLLIKDFQGNNLMTITPQNINNFARSLLFDNIKEINFGGCINMDIVNNLYCKLIERGKFNIAIKIEEVR